MTRSLKAQLSLYIQLQLILSRTYITANWKFELPSPEDIDQKVATKKSLIKRISQCLFLLISFGREMQLTPNEKSREFFEETKNFLNDLRNRVDFSKNNLKFETRVILHETKLCNLILDSFFENSNSLHCLPFDKMEKNVMNRRQYQHPSVNSSFNINFSMKIVHDLKQSTQKEQLNLTLYTFFSKHANNLNRINSIKSVDISSPLTNVETMNFTNVPCPNVIDGQHAVIRFAVYAWFYPESAECEGFILPYKRKRPFYNGFFYLVDLVNEKNGNSNNNNNKKSFRIDLKDSSLQEDIKDENGYMQRDKTTHIHIDLVLKDFSFNDEKIHFEPTFFSQQIRNAEIETMKSMTNRHYEYLEKAKPIRDDLRKMHVPRWPVNMHDILIPASFFLLDLPENKPPTNMLEIALDLNDMNMKTFIQIVSNQFNVDKKKTSTTEEIDPCFHMACLVAFKAVCLFSNASDYTPDIKYIEKEAEVKGVERFMDGLFTFAVDCEDSAKMILATFFSWCEMDLTDAFKKKKNNPNSNDDDVDDDNDDDNNNNDNEKNEALYWFQKVLKLFVCVFVDGSAFSSSGSKTNEHANKNDYEGDDDDNKNSENKICHAWVMLFPKYIVSTKWSSNEKYDHQFFLWEKSLFPWILEGTSDSDPCPKPRWEICDPKDKEKVKRQAKKKEETTKNVFGNYKFLRKNFTTPGKCLIINKKKKENGEDHYYSEQFYDYANEFKIPYYAFRNGNAGITFEVSSKISNTNTYGIKLEEMIYNPENVQLSIALKLENANELKIAMDTISQQWPIYFPDITKSSPTLLKSLFDLQKIYPVKTKKNDNNRSIDECEKNIIHFVNPSVDIYCKDLLLITKETVECLSSILSSNEFGIYGIKISCYAFQIKVPKTRNEREIINFVKISLFYNEN